MKKTMIFIISILLIISSLSVVCFASGKIAVATGNNSNNVIIKDDPEITNKTAEKNTGNIPLETDPVTTNAYQYAENLKNTSATTTTTELTNSENVTHNNIINPNNDKKIYMNATFVSDVPEAVENNILISVYNKDTNETFDFSLPKNNRFFLMVELPIGNYVYTKIHIPNNENNRFVAEYTPFTVGRVMNCIVNFNVIDTEATTKQNSTQTTISNIVTSEHTSFTTDTDIVVEPDVKNESKFGRIIVPVVILLLTAGFYIFRKANKKSIDNGDLQNDTQTPTNRF